MVGFIVYLVISAIFAYIAYRMAKSRNRNVTLWVILGFILGLIAIIILAIIGKSKAVASAN